MTTCKKYADYSFFDDDRESEIVSFNYDLTYELISHLFLMRTHVSTLHTRSLSEGHLRINVKLSSLIVLDAYTEIGKVFVN